MSKSRLSKIPWTYFKKGTLKPLEDLRPDVRELIRATIEDIPVKAGWCTFIKRVIDVRIRKDKGYTWISVMIHADLSSYTSGGCVGELLEGELMEGFYLIQLNPILFTQESYLTVTKLCSAATCRTNLRDLSLNENKSIESREGEGKSGEPVRGRMHHGFFPGAGAGDDSPQSRTHHDPFPKRDDDDDDEPRHRTHHSQ